MSPEALEGPGEVGLYGHALGATGGDNPEQDARAVRAFGASGEEHVQSELGDVLELALGRRIVDRDVGVVDEAKERGAVIFVIPNSHRQRFGGQEGRSDGAPSESEVVGKRSNTSLSMLTERLAR